MSNLSELGGIPLLLERKYRNRITPRFAKDVNRLKKGEPIDYLIGSLMFLGCKIDLSRKPFIPRPETEYWVRCAIKRIARRNAVQPIKCLDIFSGSGCIGIALLKHLPRTLVHFADNRKRSLNQIKLNLALNNIRPGRYRVVASDIFAGIRNKYDYIFANPPYVAKSRKNEIQKSVLEWEPRAALWAGERGLSFIKPFLKEARVHLKPRGHIYLEFDPQQKKEISLLLGKLGYKTYCFHRDQYKKWRFAVMQS